MISVFQEDQAVLERWLGEVTEARAPWDEAIWLLLQVRLLASVQVEAPWKTRWDAWRERALLGDNIESMPFSTPVLGSKGGWEGPSASAWAETLPLLVAEPLSVLEDRYQDVLRYRWDGNALTPSAQRRSQGSWYTPAWMVEQAVQAALDGLTEVPPDFAVLDPAVGSGRFLAHAARELRQRGLSKPETALYGVDRDPVAVLLARGMLWAQLCPSEPPFPPWTRQIQWANALTTRDHPGDAPPALWESRFPQLFHADHGSPGFDAVLSNPPWIAHAGRAAQALTPSVRADYLANYRAFSKYRTTHGLFVELSARLLRNKGKMALVLPTSVADLDGYAPVRAAHDALAHPVGALRSYDARAFEGVFQPSLLLVSAQGARNTQGDPWIIDSPSVDEGASARLQALERLPRVSPKLFGERGLQSDSTTKAHIQCGAFSEGQPLRRGTDVRAFALSAPSCRASLPHLPLDLSRFRPVDVLIRQTARVPIAAVSDGLPFRNSILAGFAHSPWTPHALAAFLNSAPVAWLHYHRFRDAREGMPQVKIKHLRELPMPAPAHIPALDSLGRAAARGHGDPKDLTALVAKAWGMSDEGWELPIKP